MLRHKTRLRLSSVDEALYSALTGQGHPSPKSVSDYNERLRSAADAWSRAKTLDERLLGHIAEMLMLDEDDETSVLDIDKLQVEFWH
jgi:hypothetical protein